VALGKAEVQAKEARQVRVLLLGMIRGMIGETPNGAHLGTHTASDASSPPQIPLLTQYKRPFEPGFLPAGKLF
jgi:hypothetical protein